MARLRTTMGYLDEEEETKILITKSQHQRARHTFAPFARRYDYWYILKRYALRLRFNFLFYSEGPL